MAPKRRTLGVRFMGTMSVSERIADLRKEGLGNFSGDIGMDGSDVSLVGCSGVVAAISSRPSIGSTSSSLTHSLHGSKPQVDRRSDLPVVKHSRRGGVEAAMDDL